MIPRYHIRDLLVLVAGAAALFATARALPQPVFASLAVGALTLLVWRLVSPDPRHALPPAPGRSYRPPSGKARRAPLGLLFVLMTVAVLVASPQSMPVPAVAMLAFIGSILVVGFGVVWTAPSRPALPPPPARGPRPPVRPG